MAKSVKTQIVLDADVVIHFAKGGLLSLLPSIFPDYEYVLLEKVYEELLDIRTQVDNQIYFMKNITLCSASMLCLKADSTSARARVPVWPIACLLTT